MSQYLHSDSRRSRSKSTPESAPFLAQSDDFDINADIEDGQDVVKSHPSGHELSPSSEPGSPIIQSWSRLVRFSRGRRNRSKREDEKAIRHRKHRGKRSALRKVLRLLAFALMLLGLIHFVAIVCGVWVAFFPDDVDWVLHSLRDPKSPEGLNRWPTDYTADITPVMCHSHNDYWRRQPLFSAINVGCTGVEADVWLFEDELYVGHSTSSLTPNRTLENLYVNPLVEILDRQNPTTHFQPTQTNPRNGVFDTNPSQTLVLLIDFKTNGEDIWPFVHKQLEPLRSKEYLSYWNGTSLIERAITVVVTGNAPWNMVISPTSNPSKDIFFDAPLDLMASAADLPPFSPTTTSDPIPSLNPRLPGDRGQGHSGAAPLDPTAYNPSNSYYASTSFVRTIGHPFPSFSLRTRLSKSQTTLIRRMIQGCHNRGLKCRFWSTPSWPVGIRHYVWRVLVREGVDFLSVDDLKNAVKGDWGPRRGGWGGKWW